MLICFGGPNSACFGQKLSSVQRQPDKRRKASITSPTDVGDTRGGVIGKRCGVIGGVKNRGVVLSKSGVNLTKKLASIAERGYTKNDN